MVDQLLARPQYGEKWGRHWLDVVRYADSNGYERDTYKPGVWRYRDWVIGAFNRDLPYDDFIRHQLAGDEVAPGDLDALVATGFHRLGLWDDEPADRLQQRYDILDGVADTTARTFLGMSMGCARCHDHKVDPIPQADYYRWLAFFHNVKDMNNKGGDMVELREDEAAHAREVAARRAEEGRLQQRIHGFETRVRAAVERGKEEAAATDMVEVEYRFYRDTFEKLPDFDGLRHEDEGVIEANLFDLSVATRNDAIGFVFTSKLIVPRAGAYTFTLDSADGSRLRVGDRTLIDHDGRHGIGSPKTAEIELPRGSVDLRVDYFNHSGPNLLDLTWRGPGVPERPLSRSGWASGTVLVADGRDGGSDWRYTTETPPGNWMMPDFDASGWKTGRSGFGRRGTPAIEVRTEWHGPGIWLRRELDLAAVPWNLSLSFFHDEDAVLYLNGEQLGEFKGYVAAYRQQGLPGPWKKVIKPGRNVIALRCRQTRGGQGVDLGLSVGGPPKRKAVETDIRELMAREGRAVLGGEFADYEAAVKELEALRKRPLKARSTKVFAVRENGPKAPETFVLGRGNPRAKGEKVEPGFPSVLGADPPPAPNPTGTSSGWRTVLADWIASPDNKLTGRVMVNRVWQHHFGRGLSADPSDFGRIGSGVTHPELLDWMAHRFAHELGWSIKDLHRLIMGSETYAMSSRGREDGLAADPANELLWRFNMRRLTAEEVRDSLVGLTGRLNLKMGGEGFYSRLPAAVLATSSTGKGKWGDSSEEERNRRAVYIRVRRSLLDPLLTAFDQADTDNPCPVRFSTTVPTQSLTMFNSEFVNDKAAAFAKRLRAESDDPAVRVRRAFELAFARPADDELLRDGLAALKDLEAQPDIDAETAFDHFCLMVVNLNEFLFLD